MCISQIALVVIGRFVTIKQKAKRVIKQLDPCKVHRTIHAPVKVGRVLLFEVGEAQEPTEGRMH